MAGANMPPDMMPYQQAALPRLATIVIVVAIIWAAKDVLLPLSLAMLITFALSPLATRLRKAGVPHLLSVLLVVILAFALIGIALLVVGMQLGTLAQNLPTFQANILAKVEGLRQAGSEDGIIARLTSMLTAINAEIGAAVPDADAGAVASATRDPVPVEVVENQSPIDLLQALVVPLVSPIATTGLVVVVVVFMLLEREDLRDRFIKLVGSSDLHRTTQVLQEAGQRVGQYLLVQLLVNMIYAVPIGLGLWLIGVPNAVLWGLLTLVLRFVPYVGSLLAAAFPLFLAFAVSPDWSAVLWTIALFLVVEVITSNMIEPWLYGSRTGVSPLAIIVSAIFWTWLWGPAGLVLSTPLTVCLVVLGRHIPQFAMFNIMLGDEPVLPAHARLYQRLLVGDGIEATARAEETLESQYIGDYYRDVGIPALLIAQSDFGRGVLTAEQRDRLAASAQQMVADLAVVVQEEVTELQADEERPDAALPGAGFRVGCFGGRNVLDDVAAAMLAQVLGAEGASAALLPHTDLAPSRFRAIDAQDLDCVVLTFLDAAPSRASLLHVRRIKRAAPHLRVGVLICAMSRKAAEADDVTTDQIAAPDPLALAAANEVGADFVVTTPEAVVRAAFVTDAPRALAQADRRDRPGRPMLIPAGASA